MIPILALVLLALQPPAAPEPSRGATAAAPSAVAPRRAADADPMVCRNDRATGHLVGTRVCHTRSEWERMERASGEYFRTRAGSSCSPTNNNC